MDVPAPAMDRIWYGRGVVGVLLMSAVAHAMHYCGGDECDSDDEGPNTMYS